MHGEYGAVMQRRNLAGLRVGNQMGPAVYVATVRAFCVACLLVPFCTVSWSLLRAQAPSQDARVTYCVLRGGTPADCAAALGAPQPVPKVAVPSPATDCAQAEADWTRAEDVKTLAVYQAHLARFHTCAFATLARSRIEQLQGQPAVPNPCGGVATAVSLSTRSAQPLSSAESCALKPKDAFRECDKCPEMVVVPAGTFMMGSPADEQERFEDEGPQHRVTIGRQFAVGRFSVTFDEWEACVADGGCDRYRPDDKKWGRGRRPVINVSWKDAKNYVAWLSRRTGNTYDLLSEAEREYVTRAGTTTPFWTGMTISTSQANYNGTRAYGGGRTGEFRQKTLPVDSFAPNPWGLYQVHGNVWDWTKDCDHGSYKDAPEDGLAWETGDCSRRIIRGGSWSFVPKIIRSAKRDRLAIDRRDDSIGFRVARTLAP